MKTIKATRAAWTCGLILAGTLAGAAYADVPVAATTAPFRGNVEVLGAAVPQARFEFQVALKLRHAAELQDRVARGETVDDAELAARYLPTEASYRTVLGWLASKGLTVEQTYANRMTVEAAGSVGAVGSALHVTLQRVRSEGTEFNATASTPSVPEAVAGVIEGINGLQPYLHMVKLSQLMAKPQVAGGPTRDATISGNYYPAGILATYQALPYLKQNGAGMRSAILIDTFPHTTDLVDFWSLTGIGQSLANIEFVKAASGTLPAPSGEETLDTEYSSGIGYGSKVRVYATTSLAFTKLDSGYQAILSDLGRGVAIQELSISLGSCEPFTPRVEVVTEGNLLTLIAAKKVTILVSSGDSGAFECGRSNPAFASWPSTHPVVTAVGGTHLIATGTPGSGKLSILSETGWSGSGGGFSNLFDPPSYQKFLGASTRMVPDVAADADPATGVEIVLNGRTEEIGGTSASAPIWAGLMSIMNQARAQAHKSALGQLNARIYPLLRSRNFHDVVGGSNGYSAVTGYDLVTGLGSPVMNVLLPTLVAQP